MIAARCQKLKPSAIDTPFKLSTTYAVRVLFYPFIFVTINIVAALGACPGIESLLQSPQKPLTEPIKIVK